MKPILSPKTGYIDWDAIFEDDVSVYFILGQRSDGKTYGIIKDSIETYINSGIPSAYIRRYDEALDKRNMIDLCRPHNRLIVRQTKGEYSSCDFKSKRFYLTKNETKNTLRDPNPFLYTYSLNTWENSKGADSGEFHNVIYDECVSMSKYLPNEYSIFENVLSSILRNRGDSRLILLGNPINQICPYFDEFNLDVHKLKPGDVVYRISRDGYKLKFVYVPPMDKKNRRSAKFFDFRNKSISSIQSGYWEFGDFPHVPGGLIKDSEQITSFAFIFRNQCAVCEFYMHNDILFAFWRDGNINRVMDDETIPLYCDYHIFDRNVYTAFTRNALTDLLERCIKSNRQYFATNKTGNLVKQWYTTFVKTAGRFGT